MGGEQAASVLTEIQKGANAKRGVHWTADEEAAFKQPYLEKYQRESHPFYASARLWDDGVIDPIQTRDVLGLCISATLNAPAQETKFGIFRM